VCPMDCICVSLIRNVFAVVRLDSSSNVIPDVNVFVLALVIWSGGFEALGGTVGYGELLKGTHKFLSAYNVFDGSQIRLNFQFFSINLKQYLIYTISCHLFLPPFITLNCQTNFSLQQDALSSSLHRYCHGILRIPPRLNLRHHHSPISRLHCEAPASTHSQPPKSGLCDRQP